MEGGVGQENPLPSSQHSPETRVSLTCLVGLVSSSSPCLLVALFGMEAPSRAG